MWFFGIFFVIVWVFTYLVFEEDTRKEGVTKMFNALTSLAVAIFSTVVAVFVGAISAKGYDAIIAMDIF